MAACVESVADAIFSEQSKYMDRVLTTWAIWTHTKSVRLGYPQAGNIWGLVTPMQEPRKFELSMTDDQMQQVDHAIAQKPWRLRMMVFVEYCLHEPQEVKGRRFGLKRTTYRDQLDRLRVNLYEELQPAIDSWRQSVL